jgi:hypothetical protein
MSKATIIGMGEMVSTFWTDFFWRAARVIGFKRIFAGSLSARNGIFKMGTTIKFPLIGNLGLGFDYIPRARK